MRRTVSLAIVTSVLMVLGGVATATPTSAPSRPPEVVPEQVGTIEQVDAVLSYLEPERSVSFHYPGAEYVKVHLRQLLLLPGDYVTVADPRREEVHRYEAAPLLGAAGRGLWAMSVTGDTAVVTLHATDPLGVRGSLSQLGVWVDRVARGFAAGELPAGSELPAGNGVPATSGREETICGGDDSRDAACYRSSHPAVYRSTQPVARLLINGTQMCTAFRIGPANRLLTNNHCLASTRQARSTEVWFNYQCVECGGRMVFRPEKVRADRVLATHRMLDFTLFTVDDFAEIERFGHLELEPRPLRSGEEIYVPQHPSGGPVRIAMASDRDRRGHCVVAHPQVHGYGWYSDAAYFCDTEAGSSGSPVVSRETHRVLALHHFGGCPNAGVRMELIYPHIAPHLPLQR